MQMISNAFSNSGIFLVPIIALILISIVAVVSAILDSRRTQTKEIYLSALSSDYESVVLAYLDTDRLSLIRQTDFFNATHGILPKDSYDRFVEAVSKTVYEADRDYFREMMSRKNILKQLEDCETFFFDYRAIRGVAVIWYRCKFIRTSSWEKDHACLHGISDFDASVRQQHAQNELLRQNYEVINAIASEFSSLFYLDLDENAYRTYAINPTIKNTFGNLLTKSWSYSQTVREFVDRYVMEEDREEMHGFCDIDNVRSALAQAKDSTMTFRSVLENGLSYSEVKMVKVEDVDEEPHHVIVGFHERSDEIINIFVKEKLFSEYESIYFVDLLNNAFKIVKKSGTTNADVNRIDYTTAMLGFALQVSDEDKAFFRKLSSPAFLREYLMTENRREFIYTLPGAEKPMRRGLIQVIDRVDGLASTAIVSFMGIDNKSGNELRQLENDMILTRLATLVEYRDQYTGDHINNTKFYVEHIANYLLKQGLFPETLNEQYVELISRASVLHDIGKIRIPDSVLLKPARLTPEEFDIVKTHVAEGGEIIREMFKDAGDKRFANMAYDVAINHHEKWDGSGYPKGISGEDIPLSGRIMAVADVFDALVSKRPYKDASSIDSAYSILIRDMDAHFDRRIVEAFVAIREEVEAHLMSSADREGPEV